MTKKIIYSKTFWTGLATICAGVGMFVSGEQELQELILTIVGGVFIALRMVTHTSIE